MTEFYKIEGQKVAYNPESKIIKTTIHEFFRKAGHILGWKNKTAGLGINKKIIELILKTNSTLIIYVEESDRDYFLQPDKLKHFLLNNNHEYMTPKKVWVDVIPFDLFTHRMVHTA